MRERSRRTGRAYAAIPNAAMRDQAISIEARGLLALLMTYADDWTFVFEHIQNVAQVGRDKLRNMLRELEATGYVTREVVRGDGGRVAGTEWIISDNPAAPASSVRASDEPQEGGEQPENASDHRPPEFQGIGETATDPLKNRQPEKPTAGESTPLRRPTDKKTKSKNPQPPAVAGAEGVCSDRFDDFWASYPNPIEETAARRAWANLPQGADLDLIISRAAVYAEDDRVKRGFAKAPANWLRDRCWEGQAPSATAAAPVDLDALARLWAPKIVEGRFVPASAISVPLARHMRSQRLATDEQLRRAGVSF